MCTGASARLRSPHHTGTYRQRVLHIAYAVVVWWLLGAAQRARASHENNVGERVWTRVRVASADDRVRP